MNNPANRNLLSQNTFEMTFSRIPNVTYFLQNSGIPGIGFDSPAYQATMRKIIPLPGDQLTYEPLEMIFLIDELMVSWKEIYNWLLGIGTPSSGQQRGNFEKALEPTEGPGYRPKANPIMGSYITAPRIESMATLRVLSSDYVPVLEVKYFDIWPRRLSKVEFDTRADGTVYLKATAMMDYSIYELRTIAE